MTFFLDGKFPLFSRLALVSESMEFWGWVVKLDHVQVT